MKVTGYTTLVAVSDPSFSQGKLNSDARLDNIRVSLELLLRRPNLYAQLASSRYHVHNEGHTVVG